VDEPNTLDDELIVMRWRTERLVGLGYGKGCAPATAGRIAD
jgi:hypothetical protein